MKINEILSLIRLLAMSQGFYGRLYNDIMELKSYDPMGYNYFVEELEARNFKDKFDFIMFVEGC